MKMKIREKAFLLTFILGFLFPLCLTAIDRKPCVSGLFYPAEPSQINEQMESYFKTASVEAKIDQTNDLIGIIVPHAGWTFSGKLAAKGFKAISHLSFDDVIFLGVDHRTHEPTISLWPDGNFLSPIGKTVIDKELTKKISEKSKLFVYEPLQHLNEHSLEVLLPFFQKLFPKNDAVFVSCGGPTSNGKILGKNLAKVVRSLPGKTLMVISSDWSHYHPADVAKRLDEKGIAAVLSLNSEQLLQDCGKRQTELCGINGVIAAIELFKKASATTNLLERTDSSEGNGDRKKVVGYAAILLQGKKSEIPKVTEHEKIVEKEKKMSLEQEALQAVRKVLEAHLSGKSVPNLTFTDPRFEEKCGIFVTLKKNHDLRGCIGFIKGYEPLKAAIPEIAISAATRDTRFTPVKFEELKDLKIEISILSPLEEVKDISQIKIGRDGLLLQLAGHSGLLLPQVPVEWNWSLDEFLDHLCLKAGLPIGSHKAKDAKLQKFSAEVFGED